jgi:hypothetical protein
MEEKTELRSDITALTQEFVHAVSSLSLTLSMSMETLRAASKAAHAKHDDFVNTKCEIGDRDGKRIYRLKTYDDYHEHNDIKTQLDRIHAGFLRVPRSFLVALISEYDAYLGNLVKALMFLRPELLDSSERSLTFAELSAFGSIDAAREFVVEKEIETLLRKSHVEQVEWLEKKFDVKLRVDLPVWPIFVEITERRNLCVHNNAVVSTQYVDTCRKHNVDLGNTKPGEHLKVTPKYFSAAHRAVFEMGVKLGQVLWRKVIPRQTADADNSLLRITYGLLSEKRYKLAQILLTFSDTTLQKRHASENNRITFLINRALAYYLDGDKIECLKILSTQDWSATRDLFRLAERVLHDDFDAAKDLMVKIGKDDPPHKADYLHWPLFAEFRKTQLFADTFSQMFGTAGHEETEISEDGKSSIKAEGN